MNRLDPTQIASNFSFFTNSPAQTNPPNPLATTPSTLESLNPRLRASSGGFDFLHPFFRKITNFFKSFFSSIKSFFYSQKPRLSPAEKENRLPSTKFVQNRLARQMQHCQRQMEQESVKSFQYRQAPANWGIHEEVVGGYSVGVSHIQGRRPTMEDEHLAVSFHLNVAGRSYPVQLFGVFDGHGGPLAAQFVRDHLQRTLTEMLNAYNPTDLTDAGIWKALKMVGVRLNHDFKNAHGNNADIQGTTVTTAMVLNEQLWSANIGDSRAVLDNCGTSIQLTEDANPEDTRYKKGIEYRGGRIENDRHGTPRVNGCLALARAVGDNGLNGAISARSKITKTSLSSIAPNSHLILCCDGVYDVSRTYDIVNAAHQDRNLTAGRLAANITYSAYQAGSADNLSALVIKMNRNMV